MKRLCLLLFGVLLLNFSVFAQIDDGITQRGMATQEIDIEGFYATHDSFPLGANVRVVNNTAEKEIDVVIIGRIETSPDRVVDLSRDAWNALNMAEGDEVMLVYPAPPSQIKVVQTKPAQTKATQTKPAQPAPTVVEPQTPEPAAKPVEISQEEKIIEKIIEKNIYETARLKNRQPLYHLLILDRRYCKANSDISNLQNIRLLYKFSHGRNGYLVAVYASSTEGPVFPVMPDRSRVIVDLTTTNLAFIRDYTNSAPFRRFVTHRHVIIQLRKALR